MLCCRWKQVKKMAVMQWIGTFFSLNWLNASAAIFGILALGAGLPRYGND
jgi:hypothetical protein